MARRILNSLLCDRPYGRTRVLRLRQLSIHDYATLTREYQTDRPSKKHLNRCPLYPQKAKLMKAQQQHQPKDKYTKGLTVHCVSEVRSMSHRSRGIFFWKERL
jgi:hypothetical protein